MAPKEPFLLFSTIFCCLLEDLCVKTGTRFSLRDKRLFEIQYSSGGFSPCPTTALTSNKYHNFVNKLIKFQENIANSFQVTERTQIYYRNH